MIDVSVIMPVYNGEKYLRQSLDGIVSQTLTNIEIICIDDASDDSTSIILAQYAEKDLRIKIITNQERSGAAISRNKGMSIAKGNYLIFLDADDLFERNLLEIIHINIVKYNGKVLQFPYDIFNDEVYEKKINTNTNIENIMSQCTVEILDINSNTPNNFLNYDSSLCNKFFKSEFIKNENIYFQDISSCNDVCFVLLSSLLADNILQLSSIPLTHYRQHDTPTRISFYRDPMCVYLSYRGLQDELIKRNKWLELTPLFLIKVIYEYIGVLNRGKNIIEKEKFYMFLQNHGFKEICNIGKINIDSLDVHIQKLLVNFLQLPFSTFWFENIVRLDYNLKTHTLKLINLFTEAQAKGKKIGLWGAGKNGYAILKFCKNNNLDISAVIDNDKEKQGTTLFNIKVSDFHELKMDLDIILVSSSNIYNDVYHMIHSNNRKFELIDIQLYLNKC